MPDVVYDLGEVRREARWTSRPGVRIAPLSRTEPTSVLPAVAATISLVLPGAGHLVLGDGLMAVFFASCFSFAAAACWALATTMGRIVPALDVLDIPRWSIALSVPAAALLGAGFHVASAVHAHTTASRWRRPAIAHPILASLASAILPGWGQLLSGRLAAGATFLGLAWLSVSVWALVWPPVQSLLRPSGISVPPALRESGGAVVLIGGSALVWLASLLDAVSHSRVRR